MEWFFFALRRFIAPSALSAIYLNKSKTSEGFPGKARSSWLAKLGPGLITGASDDDPSGIATYSQVGAQFGYGLLWVMLFSYPLMAVIQEICARIGRVTGAGIAANMRKHYSPRLLYATIFLLCGANVFNLSADIGAIGAASQLMLGGPAAVYVLLLAIVSLLLQIFVHYKSYVKYLKWLTAALLSYVLTSFLVHVDWVHAMGGTLVPSFSRDPKYFIGLTAVLGTTLSPYLFFWQASEEAEDVRVNSHERPLKRAPRQAFENLRRIRFDTYVGMGISNLIAWFIILTAAATLHVRGIADIHTSAEAAKALEPLAGRFSSFVFAAGIIGTGLLAIPVLAGSAAYGVAEAFKWRASLEQRPEEAKKFYFVLALATLIGLLLNFAGIDPIRALFWSAVLNGIVAVPLMAVTMLMSANRKVMGQFTVSVPLRIAGWVATVVMFLSSVGLFAALRH